MTRDRDLDPAASGAFPSSRVVVVGGTGESGSRILRLLRQSRPDLSLTSAGRRAPGRGALPAGVNSVLLDVTDERAAVERLRGFDLAVLALGPVERFGARPQRACVAAGVDCIDINDSLAVAEAVHGLHELAQGAGRAIYTGMGLAPGLSTLLLMQLASAGASKAGVYRSRLYMGAAYGGGPTSPYTILASFQSRLHCLVGGEHRITRVPWGDQHSTFRFRGQVTPVPLVPFATPELVGLAGSRFLRDDAPVLELDSRYHIQFLSPTVARVLARTPGRARIDGSLARKFYEGGQSLKRRANADPDTCLWVYADDDPTTGLVVHGEVSSYDLTAHMACAAVDGWLDGSLRGSPGVWSVEILSGEQRTQLRRALARRGVVARAAPGDEAPKVGWVQPVPKDFEALRHYGESWYTARPAHPRMAALQKEYLVRSRLWSVLRAELRVPRFALFVARVLRHWRRDYVRLDAWRRRGSVFRAVTRDVSMFTSGYGNLRSIVGPERALELYSEMFFATGAMEMGWLWPSSEVFAAVPAPALALREYWLGFMRRCAGDGLLELRERRLDAGHHECIVQRCSYATMFEELGCPELSGLIREMERRALVELAGPVGLGVDWVMSERGQATIVLAMPAAEGPPVRVPPSPVERPPGRQVPVTSEPA